MATVDIAHFCSMDVLLGDPPNSIAPSRFSYYAGDEILGSVSIRSKIDVRFDSLDIYFIGVGEESTTLLNEKTTHRFQTIKFRIDDTDLPPGNIFQKNYEYRFKFAFDGPARLSGVSCNHFIRNVLVREAHLQPPPSFGDSTIAGFDGRLHNDFAPSACKIIYKIQAKLSRKSLASAEPQIMLQRSLNIRVKPTGQALIPSSMYSGSQYHPQQTIDIRNRGSNLTLGRLVATIIAPELFYLPSHETNGSMRQTVRISLRYDKIGRHEDLPRVHSLRGRLIATTFFTNTFHCDIPAKKKDIFGQATNFSDSILTRFSHPITSLKWTSEQSAYSSSTLLVPVNISHQYIIPTFHSCHISRVYTLELRLKVHGAPSVEIAAPIHILPCENQPILPPYSE
ncbi:hypothetical protein N7447_005328 [Penicillium robsamsonii]|uniref:uncharacterized protein n=1 Tax=Penicillium robsamsonii TaxID=1792511 RepID=UPI002548EE10|nr:uncharacterized protein N7447_005328 [Penicillium robsamsonii]KAJ5822988.1 hypothetical protein N7447_005328 [Penicillium robsamsonii]